jgi:CBS domain-containing protein
MKENILVSDIMTRFLVTVTPNTSANKVSDIFETHNMHHLPVVEKDTLKGIISNTDVLKITHCIGLLKSKQDLQFNEDILNSVLSEEIMTTNIVTVEPTDLVSKAAALFASNKFHALPVVQGEKLVGILTTFDLIEYAYNQRLKPVAF